MPTKGDDTEWVLDDWVRRDLRDAKDERDYHLQQWRVHRWECCPDDIEADLRAEMESSHAEFLRHLWACHKGRGAPAPELAWVLAVTERAVERYLGDFRSRLRSDDVG